jgi:hypothetical protein
MVLFHHIVEIFALTQTDTARQNPLRFSLQPFQCRREGRVLVHIDDSRHWIARSTQSLTEEAFSGRSIALRAEQKIDGLTGGIHGTIEELVLALDLYICLVSAVAFVGGLQVWPAAFVPFGSVGLDPAPDTAGIHSHSAFGQKLGNVLISEGISEVPADAENNHLARELATFERIGRSDWHGLLPYQTQAQTSQWNLEAWIALSARGYTGIPLALAVLGLTLAMIGPGVWSADARLFGWRHIALPEP